MGWSCRKGYWSIEKNQTTWRAVCKVNNTAPHFCFAPPTFKPWTEEDEKMLQAFKKEKIEMQDTNLGRMKAVEKMKMVASVSDMSKGKRDTLHHKLDAMDENQSIE